jgi:hypothetical protein
MCEDPRVHVVGEIDGRWVVPLAGACFALAARSDRDESARASIYGEGQTLIVVVNLADGRVASRFISNPESLALTLDALLSIPHPGLEKSPKPRPAGPLVSDPDSPKGAPDLGPAVSERGSAMGIDGGVAFGPRVGGPGPEVAVSLSGYAQLRIRAWLVGMGLRGDLVRFRAGDLPPLFEMDTLALALTVARRFSGRVGSFDLGLSPRLVLDTQSAQLVTGEIADSSTDVRCAVFGRLGWGRGAFRLLIEGDLELSPGNLRRDRRIDPSLPILPGWTAGLAAGVTWAEP